MSLVFQSRSGPDSKLHLAIPVDRPGADFEVEIVLRSKPAMTQKEWRDWVASMAGSITDPNFVRPPQLPYEEREPIS